MSTLANLDQQLRTKKLNTSYLIYGPEAHLRRTAVEQIRAVVNEVAGTLIEPMRHDAATTTAGRVLEQAQGLGLFASHQLIEVSHIDQWKVDDLGHIAAYVESPNPSTTLILIGDKLDGRTKAGKVIMKAVFAVQCKPLYANQIPDWIRMECRRRGKNIAHDAANLLADAVGVGLGALDQAIEKVMLFCGDAKLVDAAAVEKVVLETSVRDVFAFTGAVGQRNVQVAVKCLERLLGANEPAVRLSAMLVRHWRLLLRARELMDHKQGDQQTLARVLKVHPFFVKEYAQQCRNFQPAQLAKGLEALAQTDRQLKRTQRSPQAIMTNCILQLCQP